MLTFRALVLRQSKLVKELWVERAMVSSGVTLFFMVLSQAFLLDKESGKFANRPFEDFIYGI